MSVFILTVRKNDESLNLVENLGVFSKPSIGMSYVIELIKARKLTNGRFCFTTVEELIDRENEIDFNPSHVKIFENDFYKIMAEQSIFK